MRGLRKPVGIPLHEEQEGRFQPQLRFGDRGLWSQHEGEPDVRRRSVAPACELLWRDARVGVDPWQRRQHPELQQLTWALLGDDGHVRRVAGEAAARVVRELPDEHFLVGGERVDRPGRGSGRPEGGAHRTPFAWR